MHTQSDLGAVLRLRCYCCTTKWTPKEQCQQTKKLEIASLPLLLLVIVRTKPFEDDPYMWCVGIYFWCPIVVVGTTFDPPNITSLFVTLCDTIVMNAVLVYLHSTHKSPLCSIMQGLKLFFCLVKEKSNPQMQECILAINILKGHK